LQRNIAPVSFSSAQVLINPSQWLLFAKATARETPIEIRPGKGFQEPSVDALGVVQ
jgi:hypothetical protein